MALNQLQVKTTTNLPQDAIAANIRANTDRVFEQWGERPCHIVGGGPSLRREEVLAHRIDGETVFALNNAGAVVPANYIIMMDARRENAQMDVIQHARRATYLLASQVHPEVYDWLDRQGAAILQWHAAGAAGLRDLGIKGVGGGGTVLTRAVPIAYEMGFRQFHLYGVDSSYADDGRHHAYKQALNDGAATIEVFTPHGKTRFVTTGALAEQAQQCMDQWQSFETLGCVFHIYGEGLLPTLWREAKEHKRNLDVAEPAKYRRMWDHPGYRKWSPGETQLERIKEVLGIERRALSHIIDFGCGSGRAAAQLIRDGYYVTAIDFAENCLDEDSAAQIANSFICANLWDKGLDQCFVRKATWGLCTDVMEHIPTEKVDAVLANIAASAQKTAFTISFVPDNFGRTINETLHLTVRPADWWQVKLGQHFETVTYHGDGLFVCEAKR